jgi:hypothetical protein
LQNLAAAGGQRVANWIDERITIITDDNNKIKKKE